MFMCVHLWLRHAWRLALPLAALCCAPGAQAAEIDFLSAQTLSLSGDLRLVAVDGEESWVNEGFGRLRSGSHGDWRFQPEVGNADLVWQPRFGWAFSATIVGSIQGGERTEAGISQAFLSYKPLGSGKVRVSARAGLMWPPVSLEHEGADWHVRDTITPSAINSWIGEEVRPAAIEATAKTQLGEHAVDATAALFAANDTAGTLLTFRGWALHDRRTLAFNRQPLPPLGEEFEYYQPQFTHPLLDVREGFADRIGYYAKLGWQPPLPLRVELFRYDNHADPEAVNEDLEWGWRTRFTHLGAVADLGGGTELKLQALTGQTTMGMDEGAGTWIKARFRSAFALLTVPVGTIGMTGRIEAFDVRQHGSLLDEEYDDEGWAFTLAGKREFGRLFTGLIEFLHVSTGRDQREEHGLSPRQQQTAIQASLRLHW
jgi:hypothetical protein